MDKFRSMDVFSIKEPEKYAQVRDNPIINEIKEISISHGGSSVSKALISMGYTYSLAKGSNISINRQPLSVFQYYNKHC